jgi:hypothetical protein
MISSKAFLVLLLVLAVSVDAYVPSKISRSVLARPISFSPQSLSSSRSFFTANRSPSSLASATDQENSFEEVSNLVGDDAAYFSMEQQKLGDWIKFTLAVGAILAATSWLWLLPSGPHWGNLFLETIQSTTGTTDPAVTVFSMLTIFAVSHSGLLDFEPTPSQWSGPEPGVSCLPRLVYHSHSPALAISLIMLTRELSSGT